MIPFWVRRLCTRFNKLWIVYKYKSHRDRIEVWYKTGLKRTYVFQKSHKEYRYALDLTQAGGNLETTISIGNQFQWYPLNPNQKADLKSYFLVPRHVINRASLIQKEVLVHELLYKLKSKWKPCLYGFRAVQDEIETMEDYDKVFTGGMFNTCKRRMGRAVIESYFDVGSVKRGGKDHTTTLKYAFNDPKTLYVALQILIKNTRNDVNMQELTRVLYGRGFGPVWVNPAFYIVLFRHLHFDDTRTYFDPTPWLGSKLIACSIMEAKYAPEHTETIDYAVDRGLEEAINCELTPFKPPFDVLLIDNNFQRMQMEDIDHYMALPYNDAIIFVKNDHARDVRKKHPPQRILKIKTAVGKSYDYLFAYGNSNIL
jgi:hypothetical protein